MTLGEWLQTWYDLYVEPSELAYNTKACYNRAVEAVKSSSLASLALEELTPLHLRRWLLSVAEETPRAAQLDRVMLSRALKIAAKLRLCPSGLVDPDVCPKTAHRPQKAAILTLPQLEAYMRRAAQLPEGPLLLLCCCGLRRGEALGVMRSDFDFRAGTLRVQRQRLRQGGRLIAAGLKTEASERLLVLPPIVLDICRRAPIRFPGWLVDSTPDKLHKAHGRVIADLSLPHVTLHGLRHSYATAAVMGGTPIKVLQRALGHSRYQLTADLYADHLPPENAVPCLVFQGVAR